MPNRPEQPKRAAPVPDRVAAQRLTLAQLVQRQTTSQPPNIQLPKSKSLGIWVIVKGQIPAELVEGLRTDFDEAEGATIFSNIHKSIAPKEVPQPTALFIFGT